MVFIILKNMFIKKIDNLIHCIMIHYMILINKAMSAITKEEVDKKVNEWKIDEQKQMKECKMALIRDFINAFNKRIIARKINNLTNAGNMLVTKPFECMSDTFDKVVKTTNFMDDLHKMYNEKGWTYKFSSHDVFISKFGETYLSVDISE